MEIPAHQELASADSVTSQATGVGGWRCQVTANAWARELAEDSLKASYRDVEHAEQSVTGPDHKPAR
jgi:hypothetical protein